MSSISVTVKNAAGESRDERSIDTRHLDDRVRYRLIKEALVVHEANRRSGTHKVKTRGEVAGSNKKPWRQKGTGRARAGTRKSPLWRGGGVIFGPRPRDYSCSMNKKQRRLALRSALFAKFRDGQALVLEGVEFSGPSTRTLAAALRSCGITGSCLIATLDYEPNVVLSGRNLPRVQVAPLKDLNAFDVLKAETLVLLPDAFEALTGDDSPLGAPRDEQAGAESGDTLRADAIRGDAAGSSGTTGAPSGSDDAGDAGGGDSGDGDADEAGGDGGRNGGESADAGEDERE